jgi:hypothetical protein
MKIQCQICGETFAVPFNAEFPVSERAPGGVATDCYADPPQDSAIPLDGPRYAEPGRWISTSADMPDYGIAVIVATSEGEVGEAHRYDEHWRWANEVDIGDDVTHWQDLPEAPAVANGNEGNGLDKLKRRYEEILSKLPENRVSGRHNQEG